MVGRRSRSAEIPEGVIMCAPRRGTYAHREEKEEGERGDAHEKMSFFPWLIVPYGMPAPKEAQAVVAPDAESVAPVNSWLAQKECYGITHESE